MNRIAEFWSDHNAEVVLAILAVVVFVFLIPITNLDDLTTSDLTQIGTLMVLVVVTVSYAASTHRIEHASKEQVEATRRQTEVSRDAIKIALDSQKDAAMPILEPSPQRWTLRGNTISVPYTNVGRGPALNLIVCVNYESQDRRQSITGTCDEPIPVLSVESVCTLHVKVPVSDAPTLPKEPVPGFRMVAQYSDIFGREFRFTINETSKGPMYSLDRLDDEESREALGS